jgi:hypothetical protein
VTSRLGTGTPLTFFYSVASETVYKERSSVYTEMCQLYLSSFLSSITDHITHFFEVLYPVPGRGIWATDEGIQCARDGGAGDRERQERAD